MMRPERSHRYQRTVPAARCDVCGCPDRTHDRHQGTICAGCGADWPEFVVG